METTTFRTKNDIALRSFGIPYHRLTCTRENVLKRIEVDKEYGKQPVCIQMVKDLIEEGIEEHKEEYSHNIDDD